MLLAVKHLQAKRDGVGKHEQAELGKCRGAGQPPQHCGGLRGKMSQEAAHVEIPKAVGEVQAVQGLCGRDPCARKQERRTPWRNTVDHPKVNGKPLRRAS